MSSSVAHRVLYLFYRYHYPFEVFLQAAFPLWSSLLGCWLPRVYGIVCLMDSPLCTCLACHIIRSISVMVTRTGHIRGLPQMYHIWVTTQWRHSYLAHWRFILYLFLSPLNVSLPRLHHHHAFATLHRHFLLSRLPDSTRACIKGCTRRKLSTT